MNRINLLPPEYRRVENTPRSRMVALTLGAGVIAALFLWNLGITIVKIPGMKQQLANTKSDVDKKTAEVKKRWEPLEQALAVLDNRVKAIASIKAGRDQFSWAKKLYQLCEIVQSHKVWLRSLSFDSKSGGAAGAQVKVLALKCTAADLQTKETLVTNFRRALRGDPGSSNPALGQEFYRDFTDMETPSLTPKTLRGADSNIQEREAIDFDVNLTFKAPEKSGKPAAGPAVRNQ